MINPESFRSRLTISLPHILSVYYFPHILYIRDSIPFFLSNHVLFCLYIVLLNSAQCKNIHTLRRPNRTKPSPVIQFKNNNQYTLFHQKKRTVLYCLHITSSTTIITSFRHIFPLFFWRLKTQINKKERKNLHVKECRLADPGHCQPI